MVKVVDRAIGEAWLRVLRDHKSVVLSGNEDEITDHMKSELVKLRRQNCPPGFNEGLFSMPVRDAKLRDCHGESIDQMPDLTIYPAKARPGIADEQHDALFFECKVLDRARGLDLYTLKGIERFRKGRYAWRMPHAGMVAYTIKRTERSPTKALAEYFARTSNSGSTRGHELGASTAPVMVEQARNECISDIAETSHRRSAPVVDGKVSEIRLRHLWLIAP